MISKRSFFIVLSVVLVCAGVFVYFRGADVLPGKAPLEPYEPGASVSTLDRAARVALHPLATDWDAIEAARKTRVSSFEDWAEKTAEIGLAIEVMSGILNTPEEVAAAREIALAAEMDYAAKAKAGEHILPEYPFEMPKLPPDKQNKGPFSYAGPQTPGALIAEFDQSWMERYPDSVEWDVHYPKAAWLQRIVDQGGEFKRSSDYSYYLKLRRSLIRLKDQPDEWRSGGLGIPPTTDFATYESAYIDRKIWENNMVDEVRAEYPDEPHITVYFPGTHPDKYLPRIGRMTYVRRDPDGGSATRTWGTPLTAEQRQDLTTKGIEPEDIEIVYVDKDFNVLTERPKLYNRKEWYRKHTYDIVPEGLRAYDGTFVSPERYREIKGVPMPAETLARYEAVMGVEAGADPRARAFARVKAEREASVAREVARVEFEHFQDSMRQQEAFRSMASGEVARALARQYSQQYLSKQTLKPDTAKRMETALEMLFQQGFEAGFRRIRGEDSALAAELERQLVEAHRPPKPQRQRQNTVPPKPSDTPPASDTE